MGEELFSQFNLIILAIGAAIVFFIKDGSSFLFAYIKEGALQKQQRKNKLLNAKNDLEIDSIKIEYENKKRINKARIDKLTNTSIIKNALAIQSKIKEIRDVVNARNVFISVFHNGISHGWRNYSRRFESVRSYELRTIEDYQAQPLAPYYEVLQKFSNENYINVNVEMKNEEKLVVLMKSENVEEMFLFPIMFEVELIKDDFYKELVINKNSKDYYIVGTLAIFLDKESERNTIEKMLSLANNKLNDINNMFIKNPKILG